MFLSQYHYNLLQFLIYAPFQILIVGLCQVSLTLVCISLRSSIQTKSCLIFYSIYYKNKLLIHFSGLNAGELVQSNALIFQ